jgi:hypothetical protein
MSKKVSEILNSDIQVPEIVQKKADVAFSQIQSERETNMSKKATEQKYQNRSNGRLEGCC